MSYDSDPKEAKRNQLAGYALLLPTLPLLYLDDGGATKVFQRNHNLRLLEPVNWDAGTCDSIYRSTGVKPACENIDTLLIQYARKRRRFSAIWLDYTGRTMNYEALRAAFEMAPYVEVTLGVRGIAVKTLSDMAREWVRECGGQMQFFPALAVGVNGHASVLVFTAKSTLFSLDATAEQRAARYDTKQVVKRAEQRVEQRAARDDAKQVEIGKIVRIPLTSWDARNRPTGIKKGAGHLLYKVMRLVADSRFAVRGIQTNDSLSTREEEWRLTREQIRRMA